MTTPDPYRRLAEGIASIILPDSWEEGAMTPEDARRFIAREVESRLRSALPDLASLLGEVGVMRGALKDYVSRCPDCPGDGIRRGPEGDPEPCQWCDAARSALSGDAGRLTGELIEGVAVLFGPQEPGDTKLGEGGALDRLRDRWEALLAAFPRLRWEVEGE